MFIKYCAFTNILKYISDSGLSRFSLGVSVLTQWQIKTPALQQNLQRSEISQHLRKNQIFNEHPVSIPLICSAFFTMNLFCFFSGVQKLKLIQLYVIHYSQLVLNKTYSLSPRFSRLFVKSLTKYPKGEGNDRRPPPSVPLCFFIQGSPVWSLFGKSLGSNTFIA